jgi:hypothetical protein
MSALNFLFGSTGNSALDSTAAKLRESQSTTTKTNPYVTPAVSKSIITEGLSSAAAYSDKAKAASANAELTAVSANASIQQGKKAVVEGKDAALAASKLAYEQELMKASLNSEQIQMYRETYGSDEHKKTMQALYEQQQANAQEVIAAQTQQDQGGFFNWIGSQFKAELAMEEARVTDQTINQLKANEMQAAQKLAMDLELNAADAAG